MLESNQESRKNKRKKIIKWDNVNMLPVKHVAEKYGFSVHTVYNWISRDKLKSEKHEPGGKVFIKQNDVEAFIKKWYETYEEYNTVQH